MVKSNKSNFVEDEWLAEEVRKFFVYIIKVTRVTKKKIRKIMHDLG